MITVDGARIAYSTIEVFLWMIVNLLMLYHTSNDTSLDVLTIEMANTHLCTDLIPAMAVEAERFDFIELFPADAEYIAMKFYQCKPTEVIDYLIEHDNSVILAKLYECYQFDMRRSMMARAVECGAEKVVEFLFDYIDPEPETVARCFTIDNDNIIRRFTERGYKLTLKSVNLAAYQGKYDIFMKLCHAVKPNSITLMKAVKGGNLEIVRYLLDLGLPITVSVLKNAVMHHYQITEYLLTKWNGSINDEIMNEAVIGGHLDIVILLCTHGGFVSEDNLITAARFARKQILEKYCSPPLSDELARSIIMVGDYELFKKYVPEDHWCAEMLNDAALSGSLEIFRDLSSKFTARPSIIDCTLMSGNLELIKYVHQQLGLPFTVDSENYAVESGMIEIVKYVHERSPYHRGSLELALNREYTDIAWYLIQQGYDVLNVSLHYAVQHNDRRLLLHILDKQMEQAKHNTLHEYFTNTVSVAIREAARLNDFELVDYLHQQHDCCDCSKDADVVIHAAFYENLKMVKHLLSLGYTIPVINERVSGRLPVLKYLFEAGARVDESIMRFAAARGDFETIKYLSSKGVPIAAESLEMSIWGDNYSIMVYLDRAGVPMRPQYLKMIKKRGDAQALEYFRKYLTDEVLTHELEQSIEQLKRLGINADELIERASPREAMVAVLNSNLPEQFLEGLYSYYLL